MCKNLCDFAEKWQKVEHTAWYILTSQAHCLTRLLDHHIGGQNGDLFSEISTGAEAALILGE